MFNRTSAIVKFLVVLISLIIFSPFYCVAGEPSLSPPGSWAVTSDYGPRRPAGNGSTWHQGIDYRAGQGAGIKPVEDGIIKEIGFGSGWQIHVNGVNGVYTYLHIFTGSDKTLPRGGRTQASAESGTGSWQLTNELTFVDPTTNENASSRNAIVLWVDSSMRVARKVLIAGPAIFKVRDPNNTNNFLHDESGRDILTQSTVSTTEYIAPAGNSSPRTVGYHLHLAYYQGLSNPFFNVIHGTGAPTMSVMIKGMRNNALTDITEFNNDDLKRTQQVLARVQFPDMQSSDVDTVDFYVLSADGDPTKTKRLSSDTHEFSYGGMPPISQRTNGSVVASSAISHRYFCWITLR